MRVGEELVLWESAIPKMGKRRLVKSPTSRKGREKWGTRPSTEDPLVIATPKDKQLLHALPIDADILFQLDV